MILGKYYGGELEGETLKIEIPVTRMVTARHAVMRGTNGGQRKGSIGKTWSKNGLTMQLLADVGNKKREKYKMTSFSLDDRK